MLDTSRQFVEPAEVAAARAGDELAFQTIYETYSKRLCGFLVYRGLTVEQAEDAVQEAMVSVWQSFQKWPDRDLSGFRQFVFKVAFRKMLDTVRATRSRPVVSDYGQADECLSRPDTYSTELQEVFKAGGARRPKQYTALNLYMRGYSYREIAVVMGVTMSGAKGLLFNGKKDLHIRWYGVPR